LVSQVAQYSEQQTLKNRLGFVGKAA